MTRVRERVPEARNERTTGTTRTSIAIALTGLAIASLALLGITSQAQGAIDPSASAFLAGALKPQLQKTLKKSVPGLVVTKVTCFVPTSSKLIKGKCTAKFTVARVKLKGTYQAKATLDAGSRLTWSTLSRSCSDLRGRRASCTGQSNTGNGLISAQLAETQILANGFVFRSAEKKAKSALCDGVKSKRWLHGSFDDVYAQLKCTVKATDGGTYRLVLVMTGSQRYSLRNVVKT